MSYRCDLGTKICEKQNCFTELQPMQASQYFHTTFMEHSNCSIRSGTQLLLFILLQLFSLPATATPHQTHSFPPSSWTVFIFFGYLGYYKVFSHWIAKSWCPQYAELRNFWQKKTEIMYIFSLMTNTQYSIFHQCCN